MMPTIDGRPSARQSAYTSAATRIAMRIPIMAYVIPNAAVEQSRALGQQCVAVQHRLCDVDDPPAACTRMIAEHLERLALGHGMALHEDALGAFDHTAPLERALELLDLVVQMRRLPVPADGGLD